jgi:NTE family protein
MDDQNKTAHGRTALALQGGGVHGAFAWGVLDRLLEDGLIVDRVSGVSSGGLLAAMLVQGLVKGGPEGARREMRKLWDRLRTANALSPLQNGPMERWLWGWDLSNNIAFQGMEAALRMFSPSQINPFGHNPLRPVIDDVIDLKALRDPAAIHLTVSATDVESGEARCWGNAELSADVLMASCCLPLVFHAVTIDGRSYWDGGFSGNPPLHPLLTPNLPDRLVLIRAQTARRAGVPSTPAEIMNRLTEIACHGVLEAELHALPASVRVTSHGADAVLSTLPISSKFNTGDAFIASLFEAGRNAAAIELAAD